MYSEESDGMHSKFCHRFWHRFCHAFLHVFFTCWHVFLVKCTVWFSPFHTTSILTSILTRILQFRHTFLVCALSCILTSCIHWDILNIYFPLSQNLWVSVCLVVTMAPPMKHHVYVLFRWRISILAWIPIHIGDITDDLSCVMLICSNIRFPPPETKEQNEERHEKDAYECLTSTTRRSSTGQQHLCHASASTGARTRVEPQHRLFWQLLRAAPARQTLGMLELMLASGSKRHALHPFKLADATTIDKGWTGWTSSAGKDRWDLPSWILCRA